MLQYVRYQIDAYESQIEGWATNFLTVEEFDSFQQALAESDQNWESLRESGIIVESPYYQRVTSTLLNTEIDIEFGKKITITDGRSLMDITPAPWAHWLTRFNAETGNRPLISPIINNN